MGWGGCGEVWADRGVDDAPASFPQQDGGRVRTIRTGRRQVEAVVDTAVVLNSRRPGRRYLAVGRSRKKGRGGGELGAWSAIYKIGGVRDRSRSLLW